MSDLPPSIFGSMDGEPVALGRFDEIKKWLGPLREAYGRHVPMRPWMEFLRIELAVPKKESAMAHLNHNIHAFRGNYLAVLAIFLLVTIITSPWCLVVVGALCGGWIAFLRKNEDENWHVNVGGIVVNKLHRLYAMAVLTLLVIVLFLGSVLGSVIFCGSLFTIAHAVMHKPLTSDLDLPDDDNII